MLGNSPYVNSSFLTDHPVNKTFAQVLQMSDPDFREWIIELRNTIVYAWDELGLPPLAAKSADRIVSDFRKLSVYDTSNFMQTDEDTLEEDCLVNTTRIGSTCNQFFPTLLKTKDIDSVNLEGRSVYDHFVDDNLLDHFSSTIKQRLQNDAVYQYSNYVEFLKPEHVALAKSGVRWIERFADRPHGLFDYDFWLEPKDGPTRYKGRRYLVLTKNEILQKMAEGLISKRHLPRVNLEEMLSRQRFRIRLYKTTVRIFPKFHLILRIGLGIMPPANFAPLTARFLYERFTEHIADQDRIVVYDPCSGWGGRILGAMATHRNRRIHYVGTDLNSDHWMPDFEMTKYEYLADYFNSNVRGPHHNSYELFSVGSEEIHKQARFKKYRGKVVFVFTSPPYFAVEGYNDEETQSYKKFPEYGLWRDGYLKRTLQTAVEWLKPDRYLCWNIADVKLGSNLLPLERDTKKIMDDLGMEYVGELKKVLSATPGADRKNKDRGTPTTRNFCRVNGNVRKYEPIYVFRKP